VALGIIALLLQDHRTMSTESVCSSRYVVTDQHWATGAQIKHSTLRSTVHVTVHSTEPFSDCNFCW